MGISIEVFSRKMVLLDEGFGMNILVVLWRIDWKGRRFRIGKLVGLL